MSLRLKSLKTWNKSHPSHFHTMQKPSEQDFNQYKKAESKALELLSAMQESSSKPVDIELAFLVAIFELHKNKMPSETIAQTIKGHLSTLIPFYQSPDPSNN